MLEFLLSHLPSIWTAVSGLLGGGAVAGIVKAYRAWKKQSRKDEALNHNQDLELSEHLESRLTKVEGRLDAAEKELRSTKEQLTQSRIREQELRAAIDALVQRVDNLIDRLENHEQITQDERDRLTSVPYIDDSNDNTESNATSA